jgi:hypothetical protein
MLNVYKERRQAQLPNPELLTVECQSLERLSTPAQYSTLISSGWKMGFPPLIGQAQAKGIEELSTNLFIQQSIRGAKCLSRDLQTS